MKKENKNKKTEFSISKINSIISKINKTGLVLIIVCYVGILLFALNLIKSDYTYLNEPNYEHQLYNEEINPQVSIVGLRTFNEEDEQTLKYSISVNIAGRYGTGSSDPKYKLSNFRMFASTKAKLNDKAPNNTYYFTEHTTFTTPITHTFTVSNEEKGQHPSTFYVRLQYETETETKIATFKEDVFVLPTEGDINAMNDWYKGNFSDDKKISAANIRGVKSEDPIGVIEFQVRKSTEKEGILESGLRIRITDSNVSKFHIDMQSWIVTKSGEYLPFIGVYGYTGPSLRYTNTYREIDERLNPEYIVAKVVYRDKGTNETEEYSYFKQKITNISDVFSTNVETGSDSGERISDDRGLFIALAIASSVVIFGVVVAVSYVVLKKKEDK